MHRRKAAQKHVTQTVCSQTIQLFNYSYLIRNNDTKVSERTRIMMRYAYASIYETVSETIISNQS